MPIDAESLGAVPRGPNTEALLEALGAACTELAAAGPGQLEALDIGPATWDSSRPRWHLGEIERVYHVRPEPTLADGLRYRIARARIFARHSSGTWPDLTRVWCAFVGMAEPDRSRLLIRAWPLVLYVYFRPEDAPPPAVYDRVREILETSIQDVAGYGVAVGPLGALFTLDTGPGFDVGQLAQTLPV